MLQAMLCNMREAMAWSKPSNTETSAGAEPGKGGLAVGTAVGACNWLEDPQQNSRDPLEHVSDARLVARLEADLVDAALVCGPRHAHTLGCGFQAAVPPRHPASVGVHSGRLKRRRRVPIQT